MLFEREDIRRINNNVECKYLRRFKENEIESLHSKVNFALTIYF